MSMNPSGAASASIACSRSASQAPPLYTPTIAAFGPTRGFSSAASFAQSFSASGRALIEMLLEDQLRRDRVDRGLACAPAAQAALRLQRAVALVHASDRQGGAPPQRAPGPRGAARHR